ncbi:uncharacterized protein LOC129178248 isoform X3 [Dunckerocampus dactyliophorus]|uniref:uncharacterized protein LOC129178248 isoform X3 n=1 Tax=Dunckerocampus dactyliophorus TaxID=161453 RepID=UPI0024069A1F|nr:uncharacterized protein LOC129178248 isoform X3 [Dunckerocampus dactyliophorus]
MSKQKPKQNCSVVGCTGRRTSLYRLPNTKDIRAKWIRFIYGGNVPASTGKSLFVCANHFTSDCFLNLGQFNAGLALRLNVKDGSVPTVRATEEGSTRKSGVAPALSHVACQTDPPTTRTVGIQLSMQSVQSHCLSTEIGEEGLPPEQQEWSSTVEQEEPQPPHIKEGQEEPDPAYIKAEEEEEPEPSHVKEEKPEAPLIKEEVREPTHIKKEEPKPPTLIKMRSQSPTDIKEEEEEVDISVFHLICVPVKTEDA